MIAGFFVFHNVCYVCSIEKVIIAEICGDPSRNGVGGQQSGEGALIVDGNLGKSLSLMTLKASMMEVEEVKVNIFRGCKTWRVSGGETTTSRRAEICLTTASCGSAMGSDL